MPAQQRLDAFAELLSASLVGPDGQAVAAHEQLPRLAVSFVAASLKVTPSLSQPLFTLLESRFATPAGDVCPLLHTLRVVAVRSAPTPEVLI